MKLIDCSYQRHADALLNILNEAMLTSTALYDYQPRTLEQMQIWFAQKEQTGFPVIGIENEQGDLLGFASYGSFRAWPAYKYTVEHSIYIHHQQRRQGVASRLMRELIALARKQQLHTLIGCIDMANHASIQLHQKFGFVHCGQIREAGFKFGQWLDVGFYQLLLDTPLHPVDG